MPTFPFSRLYFVLAVSLTMFGLYRPATVQAQSPITLSNVETENQFPQHLIFRLTASSDAGNIEHAQIVLRTPLQFSSESLTKLDVAVEPAPEVDLEYLWLPFLPPSAPVIYYWEITDSAGNQTRTQDIFYRYDDIRFSWQIIENDDIAVWWHDRPESFGQEVFDIASYAFSQQNTLFNTDLTYQIRIIIYNNAEEFTAWNPNTGEWVGGQAFPDYGISLQIVSRFGSQTSWLNDVVPHEISHLYFAQVTYNPSAPTPTWLDEGVAQYNEFNTQDAAIQRVRRAGANNDLLSLRSLASGFGNFNEERIRLSYDVAVSAIVYLTEQYGQDGLANLLAAYKDGFSTDEAFPEALGISFGQFEQDWATWIGVTDFATPTPWPLPTFRPSPTLRPPVNAPTQTSMPIISPSATTFISPTKTTFPISTQTPMMQEMAVEEPSGSQQTIIQPDATQENTSFAGMGLLLGCGCLLGILGIGLWYWQLQTSKD